MWWLLFCFQSVLIMTFMIRNGAHLEFAEDYDTLSWFCTSSINSWGINLVEISSMFKSSDKIHRQLMKERSIIFTSHKWWHDCLDHLTSKTFQHLNIFVCPACWWSSTKSFIFHDVSLSLNLENYLYICTFNKATSPKAVHNRSCVSEAALPRLKKEVYADSLLFRIAHLKKKTSHIWLTNTESHMQGKLLTKVYSITP
jgi:hypothetical protein